MKKEEIKMLVKLTNGKNFSPLDSNETKKIYGGDAWGPFYCAIMLLVMEPQACGYPVDGSLMQDMIDSERVSH